MDASYTDDGRDDDARKLRIDVFREELHRPLAGIMSLAESLDDEVAGPLNSEQHEHVTAILRNCERVLKVIDALPGG